MSLRAIKVQLAPRIAAAGALEVDLVAKQAQETRQAILEAAARLFARKGYKRTRVADIIKEAGMTPPVFYGHFPSKQQLLVESFGVFIGWMRNFVEPPLVEELDPAARELVRVHAHLGVQALSPDLLSLVRSEAMHENSELLSVVQRAYDDMIKGTRDDLAHLREGENAPMQVSDELVAYALLGGLDSVLMRASWDKTFSAHDVMWTSLCLFLAVEAVYTGRLDLSGQLARYQEALDRLAGSAPPIPPSARS
jgi:AcrR family transcriptional regulator